MGLGAAIIGGSVIGGAASIFSGNKAAKAQTQAADKSTAVQQYMYDTTRQDQNPYRYTGYGALGALADLYGLSQRDEMGREITGYREDGSPVFGDVLPASAQPGGAPQFSGKGALANTVAKVFGKASGQSGQATESPIVSTFGNSGTPDYSRFYNSPDYQFANEQGMRAVTQGLAARGLSPESGPGLKALIRFGQGLASQKLGEYKNSLAALAGIGQTATGQTAAAGQNAAMGMSQAYQNAGDARASSYLNRGSAISNLANTGMQLYALNKMGATSPGLYDNASMPYGSLVA